MRKLRLRVLLGAMMVVFMGMVTVPVLYSFAGTEEHVQTVRGEVVAVNPDASPPVMIVKTLSPKKEDFIVGAIIEPETRITRGKQAIGLDAIKMGESVTLTCVKTFDGLVAKSVHVR